ncbi:MAG TPA: hypothetical protein ENH99_01550 [Candidatus Pacearchaeota archaeon]|nr:hypothetical protein [Candidatus Pacearchaeota archaeon]
MRTQCENCSNWFNPTIKGAIKRYCSKKCGRQDYYKKNKEKEKKNNAKWYKEHQASEIAKNKEYRKINKELFHWYHDKKRFNGMRKVILSRDGNKCRACPSKKKLIIHHKDGTGGTSIKSLEGIKTNNDINNLITFCSSCHHKLHHWQKRNKIILETDEEIIKIIIKINENSCNR